MMTAGNFITGLKIFEPFIKDKTYWVRGAQSHSGLDILVSQKEIPWDSEDGVQLKKLGFSVCAHSDCWTLFC